MIPKLRYLSFLETKFCFKNLQTFENNPKVVKSQNNCQERGDRSLISHPSLLKTRVKGSRTQAFPTDFTSDNFETNISVSKFEHSN